MVVALEQRVHAFAVLSQKYPVLHRQTPFESTCPFFELGSELQGVQVLSGAASVPALKLNPHTPQLA